MLIWYNSGIVDLNSREATRIVWFENLIRQKEIIRATSRRSLSVKGLGYIESTVTVLVKKGFNFVGFVFKTLIGYTMKSLCKRNYSCPWNGLFDVD